MRWKSAFIWIGWFFILIGCEQQPATEVRVNDQIATSPSSATTPASNYYITAPALPEKLDFAGEPVPMEDSDVAERLDRELLVNMYWQSQTVLLHKRAARWFPVIEPILKQHNIPDDFKYLALIESGFTNAVSPSGAAGYWQFLAQTAQDHGLTVNDEVDERYHVEKSTAAACQCFQAAYDKFGNWTSAAASYNMGKTGFQRQLDRQEASNYYDVLLNSETSRYVFRILAIKTILNQSETYGFYIPEEALYRPYETRSVQVDSTIDDFAKWSKANGTNYKWLKILNPWLREKTLQVAPGDTYTILLPKSE